MSSHPRRLDVVDGSPQSGGLSASECASRRRPTQPGLPSVSYITRVRSKGPGRFEVVVVSPDKRSSVIRLAGGPKGTGMIDDIPPRCRPLAVRIDMNEGGTECSCVAATDEGPQRLGITISAGLALVADGVHGIVTNAHP